MSHRNLAEWAEDLNTVKGSISQMQAALNQVITKAPTPEEYIELTDSLKNSTVPEARILMERINGFFAAPHIKLGVRLRQLYEDGRLPMLLALSKINMKGSKSDKFTSYFLDYNPASSMASLPEPLKKELESLKLATPARQKSIEIISYPPALPPISNETLLIRITTDKSYRQSSDYLESESGAKHEFNNSHNGKLAFRGRALLEHLLTDILDEALPSFPEEELYVFRHRLMSNTVLTKFAFTYNLVDSYKYNLSYEIDLNEKLSVFSKIFLSYLAGLTLDGYSDKDLKFWVMKLYEPALMQTTGLKTRAKQKLAELNLIFQQITTFYSLPAYQASLEFVELQSDPYIAQVLVNSRPIGVGTSSESFEDAKANAAMGIMDDPSKADEMNSILLDVYNKNKEYEASTVARGSSNALGYRNSPPSSFAQTMGSSFHTNSQNSTPKSIHSQAQSKPSYASELSSIPRPTHAGVVIPPFASKPATPYGGYASQFSNPSLSQVDNNARNNLYALLGQNHLTPIYQYSKTSHEYQASIIVNSTLLATGYDVNKKIAAQKAAMIALQDTEALQRLGVYK
ncbi:uncharacterized protein RJT20DRAFT_124681 [Scheffersomyces xylosifermentans]|uniref:uncharacterized protein n=1 Tax=Scheffersomyces xylosifermentans TaxID=1304137 RepID=UPI00315D7F7B